MKKTTIISLIVFGAFFAAMGQTKDNSSYKPFSKEDIAGGVYSLPTQNRAQKDNAEWLLTATVSTDQSADTHFIFDENNRYIARDIKANGVENPRTPFTTMPTGEYRMWIFISRSVAESLHSTPDSSTPMMPRER